MGGLYPTIEIDKNLKSLETKPEASFFTEMIRLGTAKEFTEWDDVFLGNLLRQYHKYRFVHENLSVRRHGKFEAQKATLDLMELQQKAILNWVCVKSEGRRKELFFH
jgi:hypothetical protein